MCRVLPECPSQTHWICSYYYLRLADEKIEIQRDWGTHPLSLSYQMGQPSSVALSLPCTGFAPTQVKQYGGIYLPKLVAQCGVDFPPPVHKPTLVDYPGKLKLFILGFQVLWYLPWLYICQNPLSISHPHRIFLLTEFPPWLPQSHAFPQSHLIPSIL